MKLTNDEIMTLAELVLGKISDNMLNRIEYKATLYSLLGKINEEMNDRCKLKP